MTNTIENLNENLEKQLLKVSSVMNDMGRKRDLANTNTKEHISKRNKLNEEVKGLTTKVRLARGEREKHNDIVREKKLVRKEKSANVKTLKDTPTIKDPEKEKSDEESLRILRLNGKMVMLESALESGNFSAEQRSMAEIEVKEINVEIKHINKHGLLITDAMKDQGLAHKEVQESASLGQKAHEKMLEILSEVDEKRKLAETAHRTWSRSKKAADSFHGQFILAANLKNNCKDMLRAIKNDGGEAVDNEI